jgi:DNA-binding CsgD family transcriptional regulator/PAS domain-containing protein
MKNIDDVIDAIYAAAVDPAHWANVVNALARCFPGTKILINAEDARARRNIGCISAGFNSKSLSDYSRHWASQNPWVPFHEKQPILKPSVSDDVFPSFTFEHTEFYNGFIRAEGEVESAAGIKLFQEDSRLATLNLHYGASVAKDYNRSLPRVLAQLATHLRHAIEINRRLSNSLTATPTIKALIDFSPHPTWLLDADGRVRIANAAGIRILDERREAWLGSRERLVPRDAMASRKLNAMCALEAIANQPVAFNGLSIDQTGNSAAGQWSITPIRMGPQSGMSALFARSSTAILVTLEQPTGRTVLNVDDLRRMFHLTSAEAKLALQLSSGQPLSEAADRLCISKETARAQLKSVFAKTGTHRQSELVALLLGASRVR